jgi:hypothetical protein
MAFTVQQLVTQARVLLQDEVSPFRYTDGQLARLVTEGLREARRVRPDLFADTLAQPMPQYTETTMDAQVLMPEQYFGPLLNYVVGRAELRDDEFTTNGRAITMVTAYGVALRGNPK